MTYNDLGIMYIQSDIPAMIDGDPNGGKEREVNGNIRGTNLQTGIESSPPICDVHS